jgi:hypothetical protein
MEAADRAFIARRKGALAEANTFFRQALEDERAAAMSVLGDAGAEPTRSILFRSAASLAVDCADLREAERLIGLALSGEPPAEIAGELRDLLEQVNFQRHLELRGVALTGDEFQISLAGDAVGLGIVQQDVLLTRLNSTRTLLFRTAERKQGKPFREKGPPSRAFREMFEVFVSTPRAASMAMSLRFGTLRQANLPEVGFGEQVVDEFLECLEVFQDEPERLRSRIADPAYYRNFTELTKQIAPDGEQIRQVGFTAVRNGRERHVALTKSSEQLKVIDEVDQGTSSVVEYKGQLKAADEISGNTIRLEDQGKPSPRIIVPAGMMSDIVKPMWEEAVVVTAATSKKGIFLKSIRRLTED